MTASAHARNGARAWLVLALLSLIWGSSFILMKEGLEGFDALEGLVLLATISYGVNVNLVKGFFSSRDAVLVTSIALSTVGWPWLILRPLHEADAVT